MYAAWPPFWRGTTIESSATRVLPEPTSPWTRRFIGCGARMSSAISRSTRFWAEVRGNGRVGLTASRVGGGVGGVWAGTPGRPGPGPAGPGAAAAAGAGAPLGGERVLELRGQALREA